MCFLSSTETYVNQGDAARSRMQHEVNEAHRRVLARERKSGA